MRFVAIDFETSGLDPRRHAPVSLGAALFEDSEPVERQEWRIGPTLHWKTGAVEREYDVNALSVSGSTWPQIKAAPQPKDVVRALAAWSQARSLLREPVVAFNAAFDLPFYSLLLFLASDWHPRERGVKVQPKPPLAGPWHCALTLARAGLDLSDYKLDTVAAHFGLAREGDAHGALEDAVLAGRIFARLTGAGVSETLPSVVGAGEPAPASQRAGQGPSVAHASVSTHAEPLDGGKR